MRKKESVLKVAVHLRASVPLRRDSASEWAVGHTPRAGSSQEEMTPESRREQSLRVRSMEMADGNGR